MGWLVTNRLAKHAHILERLLYIAGVDIFGGHKLLEVLEGELILAHLLDLVQVVWQAT